MRGSLLLLLLIAGCGLHTNVGVETTTIEGTCARPPDLPRERFRHTCSHVTSLLGQPRHRGIDLIAVEGDENQTLGGKLAYTSADKDLEDERVVVVACIDDAWRPLGGARTDGDGRFELVLSGTGRLPVGMRDLFAYVPGDGTGVRFVAHVAAPGTTAIVTDVDGTITRSEDAILDTVVFGDDIGHQPGAPQALAASAHPIIYVSSRGDQFTEVTRRWLRRHGFPRGPVRHARAPVTLPGPRTVAFKATTIRELAIPIAAGIGNRPSDIAAYAEAGLPPHRILIKLPEFGDELRADLAAGRATAFDHYGDLAALLR